MNFKQYNGIFFRILIIIIGITSCIILFQKGLHYSAILAAIISITIIIEMYIFIKSSILFYDKTIDAILANDFSADFSKQSTLSNYKSLLRLYETLKEKQNDQESKELVYRSILNNIETGVLILQKDKQDWDIFLMNDYFSNYFTVPKVSKWKYLKNHLPSLCASIEDQNFQEIKTALQIKVEQQDTQTFILQTSRTKTYNKEYYIILLDSIQKVIEKKEKEAWINLMKVISHELMNSLTPIRSLTQNLNELMQQESLSKEDLEDIKQSVTTMIHRSDHLQIFVDSYRKLAMLPTPVKTKVELNELINSTLNIMNPLLKKENIAVVNSISFNRWLSVDKLQMEQVLINILTNSIYALEGLKDKVIEIQAEQKNDRITITIGDSGKGIEKEIEDKIFLPFFTTRIEGAGIGLTLSRNIIEAHGGYLTLRKGEEQTIFVINLKT
ncbi:sensor histidine kinase [Flavobacterium sp. '19STA2R22 D10 B1']|uniref:sensor histidine kinase n=1 Tax=Flavobacterium aerium TaxID=3037261 RepID=UPI00278BB2B8|nr:ATP-binding protein [Flavobacterium sp. '19STA2R22 D10 B1']